MSMDEYGGYLSLNCSFGLLIDKKKFEELQEKVGYDSINDLADILYLENITGYEKLIFRKINARTGKIDVGKGSFDLTQGEEQVFFLELDRDFNMFGIYDNLEEIQKEIKSRLEIAFKDIELYEESKGMIITLEDLGIDLNNLDIGIFNIVYCD